MMAALCDRSPLYQQLQNQSKTTVEPDEHSIAKGLFLNKSNKNSTKIGKKLKIGGSPLSTETVSAFSFEAKKYSISDCCTSSFFQEEKRNRQSANADMKQLFAAGADIMDCRMFVIYEIIDMNILMGIYQEIEKNRFLRKNKTY